MFESLGALCWLAIYPFFFDEWKGLEGIICGQVIAALQGMNDV